MNIRPARFASREAAIAELLINHPGPAHTEAATYKGLPAERVYAGKCVKYWRGNRDNGPINDVGYIVPVRGGWAAVHVA